METIACGLCGSSQARQVYHVNDVNYGTGGQFTIVQCEQCGLVYLNPRPAGAELAAAYPSQRYHPFGAIHGGCNHASRRTHRQRAAWLTRTTAPGRVLDIGCGDGLFLNAMQDLGWTGTGVEPNGSAAEFARTQLGLEVWQGDAFVLPASLEFDLITLWDVLEHTPSPARVLRHAGQLLAPSGRLALSLPNWDSLERRLFGSRWIALDAPRHLYHFSPNTAARMLRQCGLSVCDLRASAPVLSLASNALRVGGDLAFRGGRPKAAAGADIQNALPSPARRAAIRAAHLLMNWPNAVANLLQMGSSLTLVAQKAPAA